jgi:hypothetical protein
MAEKTGRWGNAMGEREEVAERVPSAVAADSGNS